MMRARTAQRRGVSTWWNTFDGHLRNRRGCGEWQSLALGGKRGRLGHVYMHSLVRPVRRLCLPTTDAPPITVQVQWHGKFVQ